MVGCLKMKYNDVSTMTTAAFCTDLKSWQRSGTILYHDSPDFSGTCSTYSITLDFNLSNALFASSACGSRFDLSLSTALWAPSACGMTLDFSLSTTDFASSGGGRQCLLHPLLAYKSHNTRFICTMFGPSQEPVVLHASEPKKYNQCK